LCWMDAVTRSSYGTVSSSMVTTDMRSAIGLHIPYAVQEIDFDSREDAIVWICNNQLGRRNITEETRKYLIGRQYEAEKIVGFRRNRVGHNQYTRTDDFDAPDDSQDVSANARRESGRRTANRLGKKYHVSSGAVQKYGKYSVALDTIGDKAPELVPQILSGNYKISHDNVVALSMMEAEEVQKLSKRSGMGPRRSFGTASHGRTSPMNRLRNRAEASGASGNKVDAGI
jgi:hypothetical protein